MTKSGNGLTRPARIETRAVHAGERDPFPDFTPTVGPIYASNSFTYDSTERLDAVLGGERDGFVYGRYGNPTCRALERAVANLEGTEAALAVGSGMAALHLAILREVRVGSRVLASRDLYGATRSLLSTLFGTLGITTTYVDMLNLGALEAAIAETQPAVVLLETIANPTMRVLNLPRVVELARAARATVIVDNTFASPCLVNPVRFGVETVVHSSTKYLSGHGDVTGGVICSDAERIAELTELMKLSGSVLGPFEAWLTLRGIKTLSLRVRQQSQNAARIVAWLKNHPAVETVYYPDAAAVGADLFNGSDRGGMLSFVLKDATKTAAHLFLSALTLCVPATTLGDVYTLVLYPPMSSHRGMSPKALQEAGISPGLIRLSAGIEAVEDIIADLERALQVATVG